MKKPNIVKQPHYVWRFYLEAWQIDGKLHVLRDGRIFPSAAKGIAKEGGFHDLRELTEADIEFVVAVAIRPGAPNEKVHRNFIAMITAIGEGSRRILANPERHTEEQLAFANKFIRDTEEQLQSGIETLGEPWLRAMRDGDCSFLGKPENIKFPYFLAMQHMRTKALMTRTLTSFKASSMAPLGDTIDRTWQLLRHIYAVNIGGSLHVSRHDYGLVFLETDNSHPFIAGDQPITNTFRTGDPATAPEKLELYYPLTPTRAMLYGEDYKGRSGERIRLEPADVRRYNQLIFDASSEMIFGNSHEAVAQFLK